MTTFDKREEGFEKKFALDEELQFKATARRNKLLGLWAADKLGLYAAEAEAYAKSVVMADFAEAGDEAGSDFGADGISERGGTFDNGVVLGGLQSRKAREEFQHLHVEAGLAFGDFRGDAADAVDIETAIDHGEFEEFLGLAACFPAEFHCGIRRRAAWWFRPRGVAGRNR